MKEIFFFFSYSVFRHLLYKAFVLSKFHNTTCPLRFQRFHILLVGKHSRFFRISRTEQRQKQEKGERGGSFRPSSEHKWTRFSLFLKYHHYTIEYFRLLTLHTDAHTKGPLIDHAEKKINFDCNPAAPPIPIILILWLTVTSG